MVRFLLVLVLAAVAALGVEWVFPGVPVSATAAAAVRAERWRLLLGLALWLSGCLVVIAAWMLGVSGRRRIRVVGPRKFVVPVRERKHA